MDTRTIEKRRRRVVVTALLVLLASVGLGQRSTIAADNIILLVADDLGWNDLPYFSEPIDWEALPTTWPDAQGEARLVDASMNRFAARAYTIRTGPDAGKAGYRWTDDLRAVRVRAADWKFPEGSAPTTYQANAVTCTETDLDQCPNNDSCGSPKRVANAIDHCTEADSDVIAGFGGLTKLAQMGLVFPRFYSNSSKCGPARAALMTGRYPPRVDVTLNGAQLDDDDITIAEYLKQGCSNEPIERRCRLNGTPTDCGCFVSSDCSSSAIPCYRTGLIGKYHLGKEPWNQGFDEYIGFGGGSRHYWSTDALNCGPSPAYKGNTQTGADNNEMCSAPGGPCTARGLYLGIKRGNPTFGSTFNSCSSSTDAHPDCCLFKNKEASGRGAYPVKDVTAASPAKGKDNKRLGYRPCSNPGLTKDAKCSYLERIFRDQARNFIVRSVAVEPFFLTVTFHAPHFGFAAPLRTEDHHKTGVGTDGYSDEPAAPGGATKYWGIIEEMDEAVGHVLDLLEKRGVCADDLTDPPEGCNTNSDCNANGMIECLALGKNAGALCSDAGSGCKPLRDRTAVFFLSDQGRPGDHAYGAPDLRGGKGDVYEGGVRVGLLAWHPAQQKGVCADARPVKSCATDTDCGGSDECVGPYVCSRSDPLETCDPAQTLDTCTATGGEEDVCVPLERRMAVQGSTVDLFPTIAEAAGFNPGVHFANGRACLNSACTQTTDGRSFLWAIKNPSTPPAGYQDNFPRKRMFATYPSDGMAVVTTPTDAVNTGSSSYDVCAYDSRSDPDGDGDVVRRVQGSSCVTPSAGCTPTSGSAWCKVPGRVCVPESDAQILSSCPASAPGSKVCLARDWFNPATSTKALYRCRQSNNECPGSLKCKADVWIECNTTETNTLWKMKGSSPPSPTPLTDEKTEIYEIKSNPSEDSELNCRKDVPGTSNDVNQGGGLANDLYYGVSSDQAVGLEDWYDCNDSNECASEVVP